MNDGDGGAPGAGTGAPEGTPAPDAGNNPAPPAGGDGGGTPPVETGNQPDLLGGAGNAGGSGAPPPESTENWVDSLGESYKTNPNISKYNSLDDLMNGHLNLVTKIGSEAKQRPGEGASPEDIQNWYNHIGRPESPEKYGEFKSPEKFDEMGNPVEGFNFDPETMKQFQNYAHDKGFTSDNFQDALSFYSEYTEGAQNAAVDEMVKQADAARTNLSTDWGDKFEIRLQGANTTAENLGIKETLVNAGLVNDENIIRALDKISGSISETGIIGGATPQAAGFEASLAQLKESPAWGDKNHPGWQDLESRKMELYGKYFGDK